jgi:hypothetical protein
VQVAVGAAVSTAAAMAEDLRGGPSGTSGAKPSGSLDAVCDFYAVPFVHSPSIAPEIDALAAALEADGFEVLSDAHQKLLEIDADIEGVLPPAAASTGAGTGPEAATAGSGLGSLQASVRAQVARRSQHEQRTSDEVRAMRERAQRERESFLQNLHRQLEVDAEESPLQTRGRGAGTA